MRPDIGKIVDKAAELGLYSSMDTNGYLFPQRWQELRNLSHVVIALDGIGRCMMPIVSRVLSQTPGSHRGGVGRSLCGLSPC